jgi:hypothetical protein
MDCPRCGLINPTTASRCDCGYDFQTQTVEQPFYQQKLPRDIKKFLVLVVVLNAISALVALVSGDPIRLLFVAIWSAALWLTYSRLIRGKNWARFALGILTFPLGLFVVLSRETKLYCLQRSTR